MLNLRPVPSSEHMDWITGHDMDGSKTESERTRTYGQDPDVSVKYEILNRIEHPWLNQPSHKVSLKSTTLRCYTGALFLWLNLHPHSTLCVSPEPNVT